MRIAREISAAGQGRALQLVRHAVFILLVALLSRFILLRLRVSAAFKAVGPMAALVILLSASASALVASLLLPEGGSAENRKIALSALPPIMDEPVPPARIPPPALPVEPQWQLVKRPIPMFHLEAGDLGGGERESLIFMRGPQTRREIFSWLPRAGDEKNTGRLLVQLMAERYEQSLPTFRPLFADMAMRAAERGFSIEKISPTDELRTKFGPFEIAEVMLSGEQGFAACIAYRRIDGFGFVIAGFYCGSAQRPADRVSLACFVDRLDLVGAGQDRELKKHFAAAERNRKPCANPRQPGRKMSWLDHEAPLPPLKLSARGK